MKKYNITCIGTNIQDLVLLLFVASVHNTIYQPSRSSTGYYHRTATQLFIIIIVRHFGLLVGG